MEKIMTGAFASDITMYDYILEYTKDTAGKNTTMVKKVETKLRFICLGFKKVMKHLRQLRLHPRSKLLLKLTIKKR